MENFENKSTEILEINDITYSLMPSDIQYYSDNDIAEQVYFRTKGTYAFRSKNSRSKIVLTFPIPLLDPEGLDKYPKDDQDLFFNGIKLIGELNSFPFCFVRSARIYSYLGVSFQTPSNYLMFGVEEIKTMQDVRVPNVLFLEVSLLFHNHMNLVKDMKFTKSYKIQEFEGAYAEEVVDNIQDSPVFKSFMSAISSSSYGGYASFVNQLGLPTRQGNFEPGSLVSSFRLKVPYIGSKDSPYITDGDGNIFLDLTSEEVDASKIEQKDFRMYDKYINAEKSLEGDEYAKFEDTVKKKIDYLHNPSSFMPAFTAYYLTDEFIFNPANNAIQSVSVTRSNIFASHHIGGSQYPYLQYIGKVPTRVQVTSNYNSKGSYEFNENSTFNHFKALLNTIDSNQQRFPGCNAVNFVKIDCVATALLDVRNFMPGQCVLSASSDNSNIDVFSSTFIENTMDKVLEESKVRAGKKVVKSEGMTRLFNALGQYRRYLEDLVSNPSSDLKADVNYPILKKINDLFKRMLRETVGGLDKAEYEVDMESTATKLKREPLLNDTGIELSETTAINNVPTYTGRVSYGIRPQHGTKRTVERSVLENIPRDRASIVDTYRKSIPLIQKTMLGVSIRESIDKVRSGKTEDGSYFGENTYYKIKDTDENLTQAEMYTFDVNVDHMIDGIFNTLAVASRQGYLPIQVDIPKVDSKLDGRVEKAFEDEHRQADLYLNGFAGDAHRDLNMERYIDDEEVRKYLDPFFFVETQPYTTENDYIRAYNLIDNEKFTELKNAINREVGEKGVLSGGNTGMALMVAEHHKMKEVRYKPEDAPDIRGQQTAIDPETGEAIDITGAGAYTEGSYTKSKAYKGDTLEDGTPISVAVYNAYRKQGLSHNQALAITAEVGRENNYQAKYVFGTHADPARDSKGQKITNYGMVSWNSGRGKNFIRHMEKSGVVHNGKIERTQKAIDAEAAFSVWEMKSPNYKHKLQYFWNNPNADPESFAKNLGKNYVVWAYGQNTVAGARGRVSFNWRREDQRRRDHLNTLKAMVGKGGTSTSDVKKVPATPSKVQDSSLYFIGDSIAHGYRDIYSGSGITKTGKNPKWVLEQVKDVVKNSKRLQGKTVVLSSGYSNDENNLNDVARQLKVLQDAGIKVILLGVANNLRSGKGVTMNKSLQKLATNYGATFNGGFTGSDRLHPTYKKSDIKALKASGSPYSSPKVYQEEHKPEETAVERVTKSGSILEASNGDNTEAVADNDMFDPPNLVTKPVGVQGKAVFGRQHPVGVKIKAKLVGYIDADTVTVRIDNKDYQIRVAGVDAPETKKKSGGPTGQWYGHAATQELKKVMTIGDNIYVRPTKTDAYGRNVANVYTKTGMDLGAYLVSVGAGHAEDIAYKNLEDKAKKEKKGMWRKPDKVVKPSVHRKWAGSKGADKPQNYKTTTPSGQSVSINERNKLVVTNTFNPLGSDSEFPIISQFGYRPSTKSWHRGLDFRTKHKQGFPVKAAADGVAVTRFQANGAGNYVQITHDAQGFSSLYMHLKSFNIPEGKSTRVKAGDVIGYSGNTGRSQGPHLHYETRYQNRHFHPRFSAPLDTIPKNQPLDYTLYLHPEAFKDRHSGEGNSPGSNKLVRGLELAWLGKDYRDYISGETGGSSQIAPLSYEDTKGYSFIIPNIPDAISVYDRRLMIDKHIEKMYSNLNAGLNISFPIFKGYSVVGNEDDEFFFDGAPLRDLVYFELPPIQSLRLATNNDNNPIDVLTFSIMNPNMLRSMPEDYGPQEQHANVHNINTEHYTVHYANAIKLKPGSQIHIKGGYSNNPNKLTTMFNGVVKEVSGNKDTIINVVCESYSVELISSILGYKKPESFTGSKNASTGVVIAYALMTENINHFGAQLSNVKAWWNWLTVLAPTWTKDTDSSFRNGSFFDGKEDNLIFGKGRAGDFRDPENKALVSPINLGDHIFLFNPSRANLAQRLFTNIYSDSIEYAHDAYRSTLGNLLTKIIDASIFHHELSYEYYVFKSTPWSVIKEMEYRHPGTLAKPLWYDGRQTMFFGTKEQLYVAKDLSPSQMLLTGEASRYNEPTDPFVKEYMQVRKKRLEPVTGFHLISSSLNLINNDMSFSRDFYTKVTAGFYEGKYEGNHVDKEPKTHTMVLDESLKDFEVRETVINLPGCNDNYMSWMYCIQELKKQTEKMYRGTITITGKPDMKAGDYAFLDDNQRHLSGIIKIRECNHYYSPHEGYITEIVPGLYAEPTQFIWDTLFLELGMAAKMALMKADIIRTSTMTENHIVKDYYDYLKLIQGSQRDSMQAAIITAGFTGFVAGVGFWMSAGAMKRLPKDGIKGMARFVTELTKEAFTATSAYGRAKLAQKSGQALAKSNKAYRALRLKYLVYGRNGKHGAAMLKLGKDSVQKVSKLVTLMKSLPKMAAIRVPLSIGMGLIRMAMGIGSTVGAVVLANPIGAIITFAAYIFVALATTKITESFYNHNPVTMFPISYAGRPYVAGINGFSNAGMIEGMLRNLKRNIEHIEKASYAIQSANPDNNGIGSAAKGALDTIVSIENAVLSAGKGLQEFLDE